MYFADEFNSLRSFSVKTRKRRFDVFILLCRICAGKLFGKFDNRILKFERKVVVMVDFAVKLINFVFVPQRKPTFGSEIIVSIY